MLALCEGKPGLLPKRAHLVRAAITWPYTYWGRARSAASVDGSAELGGAFGVFARMRVLGANPAAWTASPLG